MDFVHRYFINTNIIFWSWRIDIDSFRSHSYVVFVGVDIDHDRQLNQDDNNDNKRRKKEKLIPKFRQKIVAPKHYVKLNKFPN
jgi:hypothetical protein